MPKTYIPTVLGTTVPYSPITILPAVLSHRKQNQQKIKEANGKEEISRTHVYEAD